MMWANNMSTSNTPSIDEMLSMSQRAMSRQQVERSRATFAAMATVCPHCPVAARYDEERDVFLVCPHAWDELKQLAKRHDDLRPQSHFGQSQLHGIGVELMKSESLDTRP